MRSVILLFIVNLFLALFGNLSKKPLDRFEEDGLTNVHNDTGDERTEPDKIMNDNILDVVVGSSSETVSENRFSVAEDSAVYKKAMSSQTRTAVRSATADTMPVSYAEALSTVSVSVSSSESYHVVLEDNPVHV